MAISDKIFFPWRIWIVSAAMLLGIAILAVSLWETQIVKGPMYTESLTQQSFLKVRLPGARGQIMDRQGVPLVDNLLNRLTEPNAAANSINPSGLACRFLEKFP